MTRPRMDSATESALPMDSIDSTSFNRRTPPGRRAASSQEMAMANLTAPNCNRRRQASINTTPHPRYEPPQQVLDRYRPGKADPMRVLEVLMELFNAQHTALKKTVSHKTRQERADFLRRFFRDLHLKAGFKAAARPANPGAKAHPCDGVCLAA